MHILTNKKDTTFRVGLYIYDLLFSNVNYRNTTSNKISEFSACEIKTLIIIRNMKAEHEFPLFRNAFFSPVS